MDTPEARAKLERHFGNLNPKAYDIKSKQTPEYNCISFAANDPTVPWDPYNSPETYWPPEAKICDHSVESLIEAFGTRGYIECNDGSFEDGIVKIAIYGDASGEYTHAAIQHESGKWASKCGELEDIQHPSVLLQMELEFLGVGVSITLKPGGFHESRTQDGCWTGEVGYSAAVPGGEGADLGSLRSVWFAAEPGLLLAGATV